MIRFAVILAGAAIVAGCAAQTAETYGRAGAGHGDIQWWREARYGLFVHFGPFSQWYNREVAKTQSTKPPGSATPEEFDRWFVEGLTPEPDFARQWARTARAAGMKYIVFCAKHHEGFVLWNSKLTDYNAMRMGPGFDIVEAFVKACRAEGLKVGLYYSLHDAHHPDCEASRSDDAARRRFLDYTQGLLRELMTNYGRIDILWYDGATPMGYAGEWESDRMTAMVRRLQPGIVINDRAQTAEDFTCPEGSIGATAYPGQDWEACMPFRTHGGELWKLWRWYPAEPETYRSPRNIIGMLHQCTAGAGNLLLNVGPDSASGRIGAIEEERLAVVGRWLQSHGEAIYGRVDRIEKLADVANSAGGQWTRKGNVAYLWLPAWPKGGKVVLENVHTKLLAASILTNGAKVAIERSPPPESEKRKNASRVTLSGLPEQCPDTVCQYAILRLEFASYPR